MILEIIKIIAIAIGLGILTAVDLLALEKIRKIIYKKEYEKWQRTYKMCLYELQYFPLFY